MLKLGPMSADLRVFLAQDSDASDGLSWGYLAIHPLKL